MMSRNHKGWVERGKQVTSAVVDMLRETSVEVFLCAALGAAAMTGIVYNHEQERAAIIPLSFSNIEVAKRASQEQLGPLTNYLTTANDAVMDVFEAWNLSRRGEGDQLRKFAFELELKTDPAFRIGPSNLSDRLGALPKKADAALAELEGFSYFRTKLGEVNANIRAAWGESHVDYYRPEPRVYTEFDANGNAHTVVRIEQVYDHTVHTYIFNRAAGESASAGLEALVSRREALRVKEKLAPVSRTSPESEYAAEKSRENEGAGRLSRAELLEIANKWRTGSTLAVNLPEVQDELEALITAAGKWKVDKNSAKGTSYITYSHFDRGPKEYQTARSALMHGRQLEARTAEIVEGVAYARANAPALANNISRLIAVELDNRPGDAGKLSGEIISMSRDIYKLNFKGGFDVERMRWGIVALAFAAGAFGGGAVGWGVDVLAGRTGIYIAAAPKRREHDNPATYR